MMRGVLTVLAFVSVVAFPWPLSVLLALLAAGFEPLVPLAVGLFADTLYYAPSAEAIPVFTLGGAVVTILALLVRSQLRTGIIKE